jgi:hypothetical protein
VRGKVGIAIKANALVILLIAFLLEIELSFLLSITKNLNYLDRF